MRARLCACRAANQRMAWDTSWITCLFFMESSRLFHLSISLSIFTAFTLKSSASSGGDEYCNTSGRMFRERKSRYHDTCTQASSYVEEPRLWTESREHFSATRVAGRLQSSGATFSTFLRISSTDSSASRLPVTRVRTQYSFSPS